MYAARAAPGRRTNAAASIPASTGIWSAAAARVPAGLRAPAHSASATTRIHPAACTIRSRDGAIRHRWIYGHARRDWM